MAPFAQRLAGAAPAATAEERSLLVTPSPRDFMVTPCPRDFQAVRRPWNGAWAVLVRLAVLGTAALAAYVAVAAGRGGGAGVAVRARAQQKWRWDWVTPEKPKVLGLQRPRTALHARGLIQVHDGLCLHARQGFGAPVHTGPCGFGSAHGADLAQQWQYEEGLGMLRHESAGCLDGGGANLHVWYCDKTNPSQRWQYNASVGALQNRESGLCLDAVTPYKAGAQVHLWTCKKNFTHQEWSIGIRVGQVQNWDGRACLWAQSGKSGAEVAARDCRHHSNMEWLFRPARGSLELQGTGLCLAQAGESVRLASCAKLTSSSTWLYDALTGSLQSNRSARDAGEEGGLCIDVPHSARSGAEAAEDARSAHGGAKVLARPCDEHRGSQTWRVGMLTGQIRQRNGICLHAAKDERVYLWACEAPGGQWSYDDRSLTVLHLLSGMCLQRFGEKVIAAPCIDGAPAQRFSYDATGGRLRSGNDTCLEVSDLTTAGTPAILAACSNTSRRQEWDLNGRGASTELFTVETRDMTSVLPVQGVPGRSFQNIGGQGLKWEGFQTKVKRFKGVADDYAKQDPEHLVVLMDSDVAYGGCGERELLARYHKIVGASGGARVVVSADANQYPKVPNGVERFNTTEFRARREAIMKAFGLDMDAVDPFEAKDYGASLRGAVPIAIDYAFVNSGFVMGPAEAVSEVLQCMLDEGWNQTCLDSQDEDDGGGEEPDEAPEEHPERRLQEPVVAPVLKQRKVAGQGNSSCYDDQRALTLCALAHPSKITIDYTGSLMMTTYGMYNMFEVQDTGILNKVTDKFQCFIHANCWDWSQPMKWDAWIRDLKSADFAQPHRPREAARRQPPEAA